MISREQVHALAMCVQLEPASWPVLHDALLESRHGRRLERLLKRFAPNRNAAVVMCLANYRRGIGPIFVVYNRTEGEPLETFLKRIGAGADFPLVPVFFPPPEPER